MAEPTLDVKEGHRIKPWHFLRGSTTFRRKILESCQLILRWTNSDPLIRRLPVKQGSGCECILVSTNVHNLSCEAALTTSGSKAHFFFPGLSLEENSSASLQQKWAVHSIVWMQPV